MGKPEVPVEKLNGSRLSFWEAISNMIKQITEKIQELKRKDGTFVHYFLLNIPSLIKNMD